MRKILLNFFGRKNHQAVEHVFPIVEEIKPIELVEDPPLIVKNKFGIVEHMDDQCVNKTCLCGDGCFIDDLVFGNQAMFDTYNRKRKEREKNLGTV
mgnify:CR=1 FL=1|jgi:hypothetical protein